MSGWSGVIRSPERNNWLLPAAGDRQLLSVRCAGNLERIFRLIVPSTIVRYRLFLSGRQTVRSAFETESDVADFGFDSGKGPGGGKQTASFIFGPDFPACPGADEYAVGSLLFRKRSSSFRKQKRHRFDVPEGQCLINTPVDNRFVSRSPRRFASFQNQRSRGLSYDSEAIDIYVERFNIAYNRLIYQVQSI